MSYRDTGLTNRRDHVDIITNNNYILINFIKSQTRSRAIEPLSTKKCPCGTKSLNVIN